MRAIIIMAALLPTAAFSYFSYEASVVRYFGASSDCACILAVKSQERRGIDAECLAVIRGECPVGEFRAVVANADAHAVLLRDSMWAVAMRGQEGHWRIEVEFPQVGEGYIGATRRMFALRPGDDPDEVAKAVLWHHFDPGRDERQEFEGRMSRMVHGFDSPTAHLILAMATPYERRAGIVGDERATIKPMLDMVRLRSDSECMTLGLPEAPCMWRYGYPAHQRVVLGLSQALLARTTSLDVRVDARSALLDLVSEPAEDPVHPRLEAVWRRGAHESLLSHIGLRASVSDDLASGPELARLLREFLEKSDDALAEKYDLALDAASRHRAMEALRAGLLDLFRENGVVMLDGTLLHSPAPADLPSTTGAGSIDGGIDGRSDGGPTPPGG